MGFPSHCGNAANFSTLILEWALQDRISLLAAYESCDDAEAMALRDETEKEIKAIRARIKKRRPDPREKKPLAHIDLSAPEFHTRPQPTTEKP